MNMPKSLRSLQPVFYVSQLALLAGFALRTLFLLRESLWRDEVDAIRFAFEPLDGGTMRQIGAAFNGPFYHLLLRGWLDLAGINDFSLRYLSVVFGMLMLALVYALARRMGGPRVALIALALCAVSPVLIYYSGEGKMYSMQPALSVLGLYALMRAMQTGARTAPWWALFVVSVVALLGVHILAPLILGVAAVYVAASGARRSKRMRAGCW